MARDALKLAPGLATGMTIGPNVTAPKPAMIEAVGSRTEMRTGVDGAPASSGDGNNWRG